MPVLSTGAVITWNSSVDRKTTKQTGRAEVVQGYFVDLLQNKHLPDVAENK